MPTTFHESNVEWTFNDDCRVLKYDDSAWYRKHFNACADSAAVDFVAVHEGVTWLIEVKDFTMNAPHPHKRPLWQTVSSKVRDTLAGLVAGSVATGVNEETTFFRDALAATDLRVVFHCERPTHKNRLFSTLPDAADLQQKLRQTLRAVDKRACVVDCARQVQNAPWRVTWRPLGGG